MKYIPYDEQCEISRILCDFFEKENKVIDIAKKVLSETNLMKKSILAKAFRGELGTNNPNEESAIELLKSVLE